MRLFPNVRTLLLGGSAVSMIAGCTQASLEDVVSPGSPTPVVVQPVIVGGGGGGGASGAETFVAAGAAIFGANPATANPAICTNLGLVLELIPVALPNGTTVQRPICSLTDVQTAVSSTAPPSGANILTGTRSIPLLNDPILINDTVFIGNGAPGSANITFAPGQVFMALSEPGNPALLVVSRGSQLNAVGTPSAPIVFTVFEDIVDDGQPNGSQTVATGQWGGIAINGRAPLNECGLNPAATPGTDACQSNGEGGSGAYGGADPNDSSGNFQFIRVQHAGFAFTGTNELNSIALQGVGAGTTFRFVQVHNGADDGYEFFGGTVNTEFLVATGINDDSFDWTDGWNGRAQFLLAVQGGTGGGAGLLTGDNGIEGDNNGDAPGPDASPRSAPRFSNFTFIGDGAGTDSGIALRAGTAGTFINGVVTNFTFGFSFTDVGTGPDPVVQSVLLSDIVNPAVFGGDGGGAAVVTSSTNLFELDPDNLILPSNSLNGVLPGPAELNASSVDPETVDTGFGFGFTAFNSNNAVLGELADFVGAFGPNEVAFNNWTSGWTVGIPASAGLGCPTGTTQQTETPVTAGFPGRTEQFVCALNSPLVGNVRLTAGNLYRIDGITFVGQDAGGDPAAPTSTNTAVLTIDAGVTLFSNSGVADDVLVVSRGSQIFANGTPNAPVVMTSREDMQAGGSIREISAGEWGGLAINGRAPLNECGLNPSATPGTAACSSTGEGGSGPYGGGTPTDSSGALNFVQVRYAGQIFAATNELNSVALQGVGSGTLVDFVQILNGADDGFEWFGGTVNTSHLVATGANDDSFDYTDGWIGSLQYGIAIQGTANLASGDNGIEADNNGDAPGPDALPRSTPIMTNITLIGDASGDTGIALRAGVGGAVVNTITSNFGFGLSFTDVGTGPDPILQSVLLGGNTNAANFGGDGGGSAVVTSSTNLFNLPGSNNLIAASAGLIAPSGGFAASTTLVPGPSFPAITGVNPVTACGTVFGNTTNTTCAALDPVTFVGAVQNDGDRWFEGWTIGLQNGFTP